MKLPVGRFSTDEVRLVKWMFTAVLLLRTEVRLLEGLIYSPDKIR